MTAKPLTARIEVFRPGTFKPMEGEPISYSAADLKAIADAYNAQVAPAPVVVGHPSHNAPAYGWADSFEYDAASERLFANLNQIEPAFAELVKAGRFKKVSMQFFGPQQSHNPVPGTWYPKHVGFLGAAAPAVSGLRNVEFAGEEGITFEASFGERGFEETASIFRRLRDLLIAKFGIEDADLALPTWQIDWLDDMELDQNRERHSALSYAERAAVPPATTKEPEEEAAVKQQPDPAFAEREAAISAREQAVSQREQSITHTDNVSFAERLVQDGKLIPASKDKVVAILDALPSEAAVSFSESEAKLTPGAALRQVLEAQPKLVSFGGLDMPDAPNAGGAASFASDGKEVDAEGLARHNKALDYQRAHPGTAYLDAVRAIS